jgi:formylglycine-generating enzyme required for sulfatase activity
MVGLTSILLALGFAGYGFDASEQRAATAPRGAGEVDAGVPNRGALDASVPADAVFSPKALVSRASAPMETAQVETPVAAAPVARITRCPRGMTRAKTGTFQMGSPAGVGEANEHPQHQVTLSAYCIDKTEVTVKDYRACVAKGACSATATTQSCNGEDRADHPVNCVTWDEAVAYCKWAGKRLPTEAEWEYAARGADGRTYPWGNKAPTTERLNTYADGDGWSTTAPVGSYPKGASPVGALDLAGNVWEWTADWYGPYSATAVTDPTGVIAGDFRVIRGGGWNINDPGIVRAAVRLWFETSKAVDLIGFRCVRE